MCALALVLLCLLWAIPARAVTYFVDPQSGSDTNAGTSQGSPWQTIPGTRTATDSGFLRTAWGSINGSTGRIVAGDIIELRAGGSMTSALGGRLWISSAYYDSGTQGSPITIRVSSTWGSGHFTYNMSGMTVNNFDGGIFVQTRDWLYVRGASRDRRLIVDNQTGTTGTFALWWNGTSGTHIQGGGLAWVWARNSSRGGINFSYVDDATVTNTRASANGTIGLAIGGIADENCRNIVIEDSEFWGNGNNDPGNTLIRHGAGVYGSDTIIFRRSTFRNNVRDGLDAGTSTNAAPSSIIVVDSTAHDNGEDGFGANGGSAVNAAYFINSVAYNNVQAGWDLYGGVTAAVLHCVAHHNGNTANGSGNFLIYTDPATPNDTNVLIRNTIGYAPKSHSQVFAVTTPGRTARISSDYNLWIPRAADTEIAHEFPAGVTFAYNAARPSWSGANDLYGLANNPGFTAISTAAFATNNYRLTSAASSAANAAGAVWGLVPRLVEALVSTDRDRRYRPYPAEIGAYERPQVCP